MLHGKFSVKRPLHTNDVAHTLICSCYPVALFRFGEIGGKIAGRTNELHICFLFSEMLCVGHLICAQPLLTFLVGHPTRNKPKINGGSSSVQILVHFLFPSGMTRNSRGPYTLPCCCKDFVVCGACNWSRTARATETIDRFDFIMTAKTKNRKTKKKRHGSMGHATCLSFSTAIVPRHDDYPLERTLFSSGSFRV